MMSGIRVEVDEAAIEQNVRALAARATAPVLGVVKADGYGHGAVRSARAMLAGGAVMLGVVDIAEAEALRAHGVEAPILAWLHARDADFGVAAALDVEVAVSSMAQLEAAAAAGARIHLKVDTGLGRNGIARGDRAAVLARAAELQRDGAAIVGIMSHLAGTSRARDLEQLADFEAAVALAAPLGRLTRHLSASSAAIAEPRIALDLVRVGIAAYGVHPDGPRGGAALARGLGVRPAMRVVAAFDEGVAAAGLDDGLLPAIGAPVRIDGRTVRVAAVERSRLRLDEPVSGEAVLWGDPARDEPSADDWAIAAGTIGYEVVARMPAVRRGADMVRPAAGRAPQRELELGLDGAPRALVGEVIGVKRVEAGLGVSYGSEYVTREATTLALVGLGYADGVPRAAMGAPVQLGDHATPIRGRVAMDQFVLDVGERAVALGERVAFGLDGTGNDGVRQRAASYRAAMIGARVAPVLVGELSSASAMEELGGRIGALLRAGDAVVLSGPLGAGKTTLTRGLGAALGARGTIQSPTFVIARTHRTRTAPLVHLDAYRLGDEAELEDLDLDLEGSITVAEWGLPLERTLESWLRVEIARPVAGGGVAPGEGEDGAAEEGEGDEPRTVRITGQGRGWDAARVLSLVDSGPGPAEPGPVGSAHAGAAGPP